MIDTIYDLDPEVWLDPRQLRGIVAHGDPVGDGQLKNLGLANVGTITSHAAAVSRPIYRRDAYTVNGELLDTLEFFGSTNQAYFQLDLSFLTGTPYTIVALIVPRAGEAGGFIGKQVGSGGWGVAFDFNSSAPSYRLSHYQAGASFMAGHGLSYLDVLKVVGFRQTLAGRRLYNYHNGVLVTGDSPSVTLLPADHTAQARIGYAPGSGPVPYLTGHILGLAIFARNLSDAEVDDIHDWMMAGMVVPVGSGEAGFGMRIAWPAATEMSYIDIPYPTGRKAEGKRTIGGGNVSSAGVPEAYRIRRDRLLRVPLRWPETLHQQVLAFIEAMEDDPSQGCVIYPDNTDLDVSKVCYLEEPAPGDEWWPTFYPADWVYAYDFVFRSADGSAFGWLKYPDEA